MAYLHIIIWLYSILLDVLPCPDICTVNREHQVGVGIPCRNFTEAGVNELQRLLGGPLKVDAFNALRSMRAILSPRVLSEDTVRQHFRLGLIRSPVASARPAIPPPTITTS